MQLKISRNKAVEIITEWALKLNLGEVDEISFGSYSDSNLEITFVTEETIAEKAKKEKARLEYIEWKARQPTGVAKPIGEEPL